MQNVLQTSNIQARTYIFTRSSDTLYLYELLQLDLNLQTVLWLPRNTLRNTAREINLVHLVLVVTWEEWDGKTKRVSWEEWAEIENEIQ